MRQTGRKGPKGPLVRALGSALLVVALVAPAAATTAIRPQVRPGLTGSRAVMQPVTIGARISRLAIDPATGITWGIGHVAGRHDTWDVDSPNGQIVFLWYEDGRGWRVAGPPARPTGDPANPTLSSFAFTSAGEGWAVGPRGTMAHYRPDVGWAMASVCPEITCEDLVGISFLRDRTGGYAVGRRGTVLSYDGSRWSVDGAEVRSTEVDFRGVALLSREDAWAIGTSGSRDLQLFRRGDLGWTRQQTGQPIFDNPTPSNDGSGNFNLSVAGATIAADPERRIVWVGGGFSPVDTTDPLRDPQRPFVIRWRGGDFTSYCPVQYSVASDDGTRGGTLTVGEICDRPFPASPFDISSLSVTPDGHVFAGGLGLFHLEGGTWRREPDPVGYLASISFSSASEGWIAGTGDTVGASATARSNSFTLGHFTTTPEPSRLARWPHANRTVLTDVAVAPDGTRALAVGNESILLYEDGVGWLPIHRDARRFRAVAWRTDTEAWITGTGGIVLRYRAGEGLAELRQWAVSDQTLFGISFDGDDGTAVGAKGTILRFTGSGWEHDPASGATDQTLYAVSRHAGTGLIVGSRAAAFTLRGSAWTHDPDVAQLVELPRVPLPDLFAADATADGTLIAGGALGTLAAKRGDSPWRIVTPLDRQVSVLSARGMGWGRDGLTLITSLSPDQTKFQSSATGTNRGWPMYYDGATWHDLDHARRVTTHPELDTSAQRDPILAIALLPGGRRGWAVGGQRTNLLDDENHLTVEPTSALFRFDLDADPSPPETRVTPILPRTGVSVAFFSESACGSGPCSIAMGSGITADTVPIAIQEEVNALAKLPGGPRFAIYGGNMRAVGLPEELESYKGYLERFDIPVFGAMGPHDLLTPSASALLEFSPEIPNDVRRQLELPDPEQVLSLNGPYLEAFASAVRPWGTGNAMHPDIVPVAIGAQPVAGLARTHYAFDYAPDGEPLLRVIVIDTSDKTFQKSGRTSSQNPQQDQSTWIQQVVADAATHSPAIPTVVVSNLPTVNPTSALGQDRRNMMTDGPTFENQILALRVSAVLSGWVRGNARYNYPVGSAPVKVPFIISGTAGAPTGGTRHPYDSHYNAWQLLNFDASDTDLVNSQADVSVTAFPLLESIGLEPLDGTVAEAGHMLRFRAIARAVDGGGPPNDPRQSKRLHIEYPLPPICPRDFIPSDGDCFINTGARPDYHFISEDPEIADFILPTGRIILPGEPKVWDFSDQSGTLCTFKKGSTHIRIVSGTHQMRIPITVGPGTGPCINRVFRPDPVPPPEVEPVPPVAPVPIPAPPVINPVALVLIPPPPPLSAPAPPAAGGYAKKEEHEVETEESGADFLALPAPKPRAAVFEPTSGWAAMSLVGITALAFGLAWGATSPYRRRIALQGARVERDDTEGARNGTLGRRRMP